ncbi:oligosaccharide flippase family protein [Bacteroidota bacterium]
MELKILIKNTSLLMSTKVAQFFAGILRSKISAIYLGTGGVGIFSQLTFLSEKMSLFTTLSMSEAVVKQIAENSNKAEVKEFVCSSLKVYITLVFSFMFVSIALLYFFSEKLTSYVFGDIKYLQYFYIALFSFPLLLLNSIPFSILKGFKNIKAISRARLGIIAVNTILFIPLVIIYKLRGAVIFVPLSYLVTLSFNYLYTRNAYLKRLNIGIVEILKSPFNNAFIKEMIIFSSFGLIVNFWIIISEFICRSIVVTQIGIDSIGLYSPIIAWAGLFTGFLLPTFNTYLFPRFCEAKSKKEVSGILNDSIRLGTLLLFPLLFLGIPYRNIFIRLLYSNEFIDAAKYLPFHFLGVAFFVWWFSFTQSMTPTGYIKQHGFISILFYTLGIMIVYFLVPKFGLYGYMLKYIVSPFIFFFVYYFFLKQKHDFRFENKNLILMIYLLLGASCMIIIDAFNNGFASINYYISPILLALTFIFLTKNEKTFILTEVKHIYGKIIK